VAWVRLHVALLPLPIDFAGLAQRLPWRQPLCLPLDMSTALVMQLAANGASHAALAAEEDRAGEQAT
jgi:hypothetical protein